MKNRYPINSLIAINKTQSKKECALCHQEMQIGKIAIIMYGHFTHYSVYNWVHIGCIINIKQDIIQDKKEYPPDEKHNYHYFHPGCSYCKKDIDKGEGLRIAFTKFCINCLPLLQEDIKKTMDEITPLLVAHNL